MTAKKDSYDCFAARTRNGDLLRESTSGGIFTELSKAIIADGGVVVGAAWERPSYRVVHKIVDCVEGIKDLRGAKYVKSDLTGIYEPLGTIVRAGRKVLFAGTPCEVAAIRKTFGGPNNLFLCAVFCHSNAAVDVWLRYFEQIRGCRTSSVKDVRFRDKRNGWRASSFCVDFEDADESLVEPLYENCYAKAVFHGLATRSSCLNCQFRSCKCGADLLIGDFWGIENICPAYDDGAGVSAVVVCSGKGSELFDRLDVEKRRVTYQQIVEKNPYVEISPTVDMQKRARFLGAYETMGVGRALSYAEYGPWQRRVCVKVGGFVRKALRRVMVV